MTLGATVQQASAVNFLFSFDNNFGNVDGVVTGEVFGLVNNATSAATSVEIFTWPSALIPVANQGDYVAPIDATSWASQFVNQFTVVNNVVTDGEFHADNVTAVSTLDRLWLNTGPCSSGPTCSYLSLGSNNSQNVWHDVAGTTYTLVGVPEPSTWAMMMLGFAGLGFSGYRASRKTAALAA